MNECRWSGTDSPRILPGRHAYGCGNEECAGCQPCTEPHCRVDGRTHAEGMCAECLASTRDDLLELAKMCDALPAEAVVKGVHSEAMTLLAPVADPEARGHLAASVAAGRVPADWLDVADHERHPLTVLGGWVMVWEDVLERDNNDPLTIVGCVAYLDEHLHRIAADGNLPVEDLAKDLRQSRAHVESVLHAGEQVDRGAPCMDCNVPLERTWATDEKGDGWRCPKCRRTSTDAQYRWAVAQLHLERADYLSGRDVQVKTGVKAGTVRVWANRGLVKTKRDAGRTLYRVSDVEDYQKAGPVAS